MQALYGFTDMRFWVLIINVLQSSFYRLLFFHYAATFFNAKYFSKNGNGKSGFLAVNVTHRSNVTFLSWRNAETIESCDYRISIKYVLVFLRVYEYQQIMTHVMY